MSEEKRWQFELEEYIRLGEPEQVERSEAWQTAIGLQDVDGLKTSEYLLSTAKEHIEGKIGIDEAQKRIQSYYEESGERAEVEARTKEADIVSARIAKLLGEKAFQFSPAEWISIHKRLFEGVFDHAGRIRTYNITKKEWVLKGETVIYSSWNSIKDTLDYDFNMEKQFSYEGLSLVDSVKHLAKFASDIWQIHPFCEGNTRATAVFLINNDLKNEVYATTKFLEQFFSNLLMGTSFDLKNRYMHVEFSEEKKEKFQSANFDFSKCQNDTLKVTLNELAILRQLVGKPEMTQIELAEKTGKSVRTLKREMEKLKEKGYIRRVNGKRNGRWEVLVDINKK